MRKQIATIALALAMLTGPSFAETIHVGVDGMVCAFCAKGIEKSFKAIPETEKIDVSLEEKLVTVTTKGDTTIKDEKIKQIIKDAGYDVTTIHHQK
jgi:mercuric ion binding protein